MIDRDWPLGRTFFDMPDLLVTNFDVRKAVKLNSSFTCGNTKPNECIRLKRKSNTDLSDQKQTIKSMWTP